MRKTLIFLFTLYILLCMSGCFSTDYFEDDPSKYGAWNKTVMQIENDYFNASLPDKRDVDEFAQSYYYRFSQSALGDPNYVICVDLQFPDENSFEEELSKYTPLLSDPIELDETTYYPVQFSAGNVEDYTDEKIYDGMFFNFEIIAANSKAKTIRFINARVWDYYKDHMLMDLLLQIYEAINNQ